MLKWEIGIASVTLMPVASLEPMKEFKPETLLGEAGMGLSFRSGRSGSMPILLTLSASAS